MTICDCASTACLSPASSRARSTSSARRCRRSDSHLRRVSENSRMVIWLAIQTHLTESATTFYQNFSNQSLLFRRHVWGWVLHDEVTRDVSITTSDKSHMILPRRRREASYVYLQIPLLSSANFKWSPPTLRRFNFRHCSERRVTLNCDDDPAKHSISPLFLSGEAGYLTLKPATLELPESLAVCTVSTELRVRLSRGVGKSHNSRPTSHACPHPLWINDISLCRASLELSLDGVTEQIGVERRVRQVAEQSPAISWSVWRAFLAACCRQAAWTMHIAASNWLGQGMVFVPNTIITPRVISNPPRRRRPPMGGWRAPFCWIHPPPCRQIARLWSAWFRVVYYFLESTERALSTFWK